ncbi:WPP domain-interacting tail-anchored protein 2 isoform X2 [Amborella trichopoda]|uniref:WPP domain-interacting tail-anchored protein 2 isoform X2 n=1 Tax=Amborella trichopoda TaxID=13333 RepID=UPI0009BFF6E3|nr:WPP domain-interacting tail-anchored protein 2 isoform X2 [Amborella trichopoda]|eukprot:XP_020522792.1 WPP domain-interacting tail-anchored protein 2 isoform X2 [Amborella trichopoda]
MMQPRIQLSSIKIRDTRGILEGQNSFNKTISLESEAHETLPKETFKEMESGQSNNARELLTRVELDVACSSEKVQNLEIFFIHVAARAGEYEDFATRKEDILEDSVEKALEFDILSGILDSEMGELDRFTASLQEEITDLREKKLFEDTKTEEMHELEEALKQLRVQVTDMRMQSAKFQNTLSYGGQDIRNGLDAETIESPFSPMSGGIRKAHTPEQQMHVLRMLEKSLKRDLDLESKLTVTRHNEEELKQRLHDVEEENSIMETMARALLQRSFEAENLVSVLSGVSKELIGKIQLLNFNLNSSLCRETDLRSKLQGTQIKLSEDEGTLLKLTTRCQKLENLLLLQVKESEAKVQDSEEKFNLANSDAQSLREKASSLEGRLRQSETQWQQALASVEASHERETLLSSSLIDMENVIQNLKAKVIYMENRAENAELQCSLLMDNNSELNEELKLLRGTVESLQASLVRTENDKAKAAKDVNFRAKLINDLIMKLATERECLQKQIFSLMEENRLLGEYSSDEASGLMSHYGNKQAIEYVPEKDNGDIKANLTNPVDLESEPTLGHMYLETQVETSVKSVASCVSMEGPTVSGSDGHGLGAEEVVDMDSSSQFETVVTIEAGQLKAKYVFGAIAISLISVLIVYIFQQEHCPF